MNHHDGGGPISALQSDAPCVKIPASNHAPITAPEYAELHCLSNFTFLRGASHAEELITQADKLGYHALAITDECSVAGVVRAHVAAQEKTIRLIVGSEFRVADGLRFVVLAKNRQGYANLCRLITLARRSADKGHYHLTREQMLGALRDCVLLWLPSWTPNLEDGKWLTRHFPDQVWIAVERLLERHERMTVTQWRALSRTLNRPIVACGDVHMHKYQRRYLQDTLTAIRERTPLIECGYKLYQNAERHLRAREKLARLYPDDWLSESMVIANQCHFSLSELQYEYPEEIVPSNKTAPRYLQELTEQGLINRYGKQIPESVKKQIQHELALIRDLDYERYFLTIYDIVAFARSQNILCQGRGSAANSAVCYVLGITEVNPAESNLLFERFISKERKEPPDIDVDFEHERREEVIQYLYQKYGRHRAALVATVITYRTRSAIRDIARALAWDDFAIEKLVRALSHASDNTNWRQRFTEQGFDPDSTELKRLLKLTRVLKNFPRHLSQHVGGFVIAARQIDDLVPVENARMPDRTVIQWDKNDIDSLGLLKVDVLSLGMLTALRKCLDLLHHNRMNPIRLSDIPHDDIATYDMIQHADTIGVFQIESRAQMTMLPRLKPANFYDLVVEVAIVRPGPIQGNMVKPYLLRREGRQAISYPSDAIKQILERTYGVSIFQEQAMQIAMVAAGFSAGEADNLRRAMGRFRNDGDLEPFREKLINGMRERGYNEDFALNIYEQIKGFGSYGFPESHAASFAILAYYSAWLKCHRPAAFLAAMINSQPLGFYSSAQLIRDAQNHRVEVRTIDVQHSEWDCTLEFNENSPSPAVRLGMRLIKGLTKFAADKIVIERKKQAFKDWQSWVERCEIDHADLQLLARANALRALSGHRHYAQWQADGSQFDSELWHYARVKEASPMLKKPSAWQEVVHDVATTRVSLNAHPVSFFRALLQKKNVHPLARIAQIKTGYVINIAGLVTNRQRPGTAKGVTFLTLEDETGQANIIVWPQLLERYRQAVVYGSFLLIQGQLQREGEVTHIVTRRVEDLSHWQGNLVTTSRDFH